MAIEYLLQDSNQVGRLLTQSDIASGEATTNPLYTDTQYGDITLVFSVVDNGADGILTLEYSLDFHSKIEYPTASWYTWCIGEIKSGDYPIRVTTPVNFFRVRAKDVNNIPDFKLHALGNNS